eukprot:725490-Rhodomonas_salina.1
MQQRQRGDWDLSSLASMALHPVISREAALSLWELGWQDSLEDDVIPTVSTDYDYMRPENGLRLWWESHLWAAECESGGRSDLVMATANIGPPGIWPSLSTTVKDFAAKRTGLILLQDGRFSKNSVTSLESRLAFEFPQYHSVISTFSSADWEDGKRQKYHYAVVTLLHTQLYTDVNNETVHDPKNKIKKRAVLGHLQVVTVRCKTMSRRVMVVNTYQHTARYPERQQVLWQCLDRFLGKQDLADTSLIGGGDMNAAMEGQRFDYVTRAHEQSDKQLEQFADSVKADVISPSQVSWWDQHRQCRAVLDHVFVESQQMARASITVRNSWDPSHDHVNLFVYARTTYLPGRPAVGTTRPFQSRLKMKA